jgi:hypothetical protein
VGDHKANDPVIFPLSNPVRRVFHFRTVVFLVQFEFPYTILIAFPTLPGYDKAYARMGQWMT